MPSRPTSVSTWPLSLLALTLIFLFPLIIESRSVPAKPHYHGSFHFIRKLEGSQKGETIEGLHQLKQYLKRFGYLPPQSSTNAIGAVDDCFDDSLESAIKSYQQNFNLNITGHLDEATARQMMIPRCGVPDVMVRGKGTPPDQARPDYAFFTGELKWPPSKTHLTYGFFDANLVIDKQSLRGIFVSSFAKWAGVTLFTFEEVADVNSADLKIGFFKGNHGDAGPFDGPGGVLAHSFAPTVGWLHFDAEERWAINPSKDQYDVESVALHEIGHLLGLNHSTVPEAVMFPRIEGGEKKVFLAADDIQGIKDLYDL